MTQIIASNKRSSISRLVWVALRIVLGVILIWKGIHFIKDTYIIELFTGQNDVSLFTKNDAVFVALVVMSMVIGGLFIMLGLFTEIISLIQLPIFVIGSLFIHAGYIERNGFELVLTAVVPFLLVAFITKDNHEFSGAPHTQRH